MGALDQADRTGSYGQHHAPTAIDRFGVWLSSVAVLRDADFADARFGDFGCGYHAAFARTQLWFPGIECTGFDISANACEDYRRLTGGEAYRANLTEPLDVEAVGGPYDAAVVIGGLHHTVVDLPAAIANMAALVRPGGIVFMMEPNARYRLEPARKVWHRMDDNFDSTTEHALDHAALVNLAAPSFKPLSVRYCRGPACFLIQQSLSKRVPLRVKSRIAPPLMAMERLYARLTSPRFHAFFNAVWQRVG